MRKSFMEPNSMRNVTRTRAPSQTEVTTANNRMRIQMHAVRTTRANQRGVQDCCTGGVSEMHGPSSTTSQPDLAITITWVPQMFMCSSTRSSAHRVGRG